MSIGYLVRLLFRWFSIRNRRVQLITTAILAFVAWYIQWTVYFAFLSEGSICSPLVWLQNISNLANPINFATYLSRISDYGAWDIAGVTISGLLLWIVWILELVIIIFIPLKMVHSTKAYPYSELLSRWYPKLTIANDFPSLTATTAFVTDLCSSPLDTLKRLERGSGNSHAKIHIFYLKDEKEQYLTIEKIRYDHKNNKVKTIVLNNFRITNEQAMELMTEYKIKKEKIEII
jgi:hypothetical protein